jgi:hypothetical protein
MHVRGAYNPRTHIFTGPGLCKPRRIDLGASGAPEPRPSTEAAACGCDPAPFIKIRRNPRENADGETSIEIEISGMETGGEVATSADRERSALQQGDLRILKGGNRNLYADLGGRPRHEDSFLPWMGLGLGPAPALPVSYIGSRSTWQGEGNGNGIVTSSSRGLVQIVSDAFWPV